MAKERVYQLLEPVRLGASDRAEEITEVTIKRQLKHLRNYSVRAGADKDGGVTMDINFGVLIELAARMIGRTPGELEEFGEEDQAALIQEANDFLLSRLGTGPKP